MITVVWRIMKVAIVLMKYSSYGGNERQAALVAKGLAQKGINVTVIANKWLAEPAVDIDFVQIPIISLTSWLKIWSFAKRSREYLKKHSFDVVIGFDRSYLMDVYCVGNACHRSWLQFRMSQQNILKNIFMRFTLTHYVINHIEKKMAQRIRETDGRVVTLSEMGKQQLQQHYALDDSVFVKIPPALNVQRFLQVDKPLQRKLFREQQGIRDTTKIILHVGGGLRIKGLSATLKTMQLLQQQDVILCVACNDRSGVAHFSKMSKVLGIEPRVKFLGAVDQVENLYAAADLLVMPSLFETFNVAVVEALATGLPVIVGEGAGVSEWVRHSQLVETIPVPADPQVLRVMIQKMLATDPAPCDVKLENFSDNKVIAEYYNLVKEIGVEKKIKITVIVATYNALASLKLVLRSMERQTFKDFEVILADDGSKEELVDWVRSYHADFPLIHIWQEDKGFRKCRSLNRAIQKARGTYLVFADADCILAKDFLMQHWRAREKNKFVGGQRVRIRIKEVPNTTLEMVDRGCFDRFNLKLLWYSIVGRYSYYEEAIRLIGWFRKSKFNFLGCNFSIHKEDILRVNGFDEDYEVRGGGGDTDIGFRMRKIGMQMKSVRYKAIQFHLDHSSTETMEAAGKLYNSKKAKIVTEQDAVGVNSIFNDVS